MELRNITAREQFEEYYKDKGLDTCAKKISDIKQVTGITTVKLCYGTNEKDILDGLEDSVIHGSWRDFD